MFKPSPMLGLLLALRKYSLLGTPHNLGELANNWGKSTSCETLCHEGGNTLTVETGR